MLTPQFRCSQENNFIVVEILLSAHCKISLAEFDINGNQFTFFCRPYYLRLTFSHAIAEGKGERATYDVSKNLLTVFIPKENDGEHFADLEFPNILLATTKQRRGVVIEELDKTHREEGEEEEEDAELETEFEQQQQEHTKGEQVAKCYYGFNDEHANFFSKLDPDIVADIVALPRPDEVPEGERTALREGDEIAKFDLSQTMFWLADEEGEVAELVDSSMPSFVVAFEDALQNEGLAFVTGEGTRKEQRNVAKALRAEKPQGARTSEPHVNPVAVAAEEEEETPVEIAQGGSGVVVAWEGNIATFDPNAPELREQAQQQALPVAAEAEAEEDKREREDVVVIMSQKGANRRQLACPKRKPPVVFTMAESDMLARIQRSNHLILNEGKLRALFADVLCAFAYDNIVTGGDGCVESPWTLCALSPSLSWLDTPPTVAAAATTFCRRVLTFPLYRSFHLAMRALRDVGIIALSGTKTAIRCLLYVKHVLDHSETKHSLNHLFINPMIAYLQGSAVVMDVMLERAAVELHAAIVGELCPWHEKQTMLPQPLTLESLRLPLTAIVVEEEEGAN